MKPQLYYSEEAMQVLDAVWDVACIFTAEFGSELLLAVLFCMGFGLFRVAVFWNAFGLGQRVIKAVDLATEARGCLRAKQLEADWAAGRGDLVLEAWPLAECLSLGALRAIAEAMVASEKVSELPCILRRILGKHLSLRSADGLMAVLDSLPDGASSLTAEVRKIFAESPAEVHQATPGRGNLCQTLEMELEVSPTQATLQRGRASSTGSMQHELSASALSPEAAVSLLEHAVKSSDAVLLREVHDRAVAEKLVLSPSGYETLLRGYASAGDSRAIHVFEEMHRSGFQPSDGLLASVISLCAESRHVQLAECLAAHAREVSGQMTLSIYSTLMKVYSHARLFHKTCDLYEQMEEEGVKPDTVIYGSVIKAAVESSRLDLARRLFKESGNPDLLNYMSLIRAAGRERDVEKALGLLSELEASPLRVDATAYNCVLEVCAACGDRASARDLLHHMKSAGCVDVVSYNTYLKMLLGHDALSEVSMIIKEMRCLGIKPNVVTYNSLVNAAVGRHDLEGAWRLISEMEEAGVWADAFTCSILMKGVRHAPCSEDLDRVLELVQQAKVTPDEVLTNCLLDACVRLRDAGRLNKVLDQFKATGVVPSPHARAMLLRAYGHAGQPDRVWSLWNELVSGSADGPDEQAFGSMIEACLAGGDLSGAASVFRGQHLRLSTFPRASMVFSAFVKACAQVKSPNLAIDLYECVKGEFACTKVTYNTLIDMLVRQSDSGRADAVFRDMALNAVTPDLITYSTMIKGHCARGDLEQGLQLLGLMQRRGISPDAVLFNSILDGCAHKQMRTLTEQVLRDMEAANIAPSNFTLSILIKLYGRCNDVEAAFEVVDTYPKMYGFKLNAQVYTCLMSACISNNALPRALEVYESMKASGCMTDGKTYQTLLSGCVRHSDLDAALSLIEDALSQGPAVRLDKDVTEAVLLLAVRQGRSSDVAVPLLGRLRAAGVPVSDRIATAATRQVAEAGSPKAHRLQGPIGLAR
eukprot:CAMPEP_0170613986 /NCGR_PEP_ID=MMETSP0224-20130122/24561_1 /TAXON_ID=285029 /ORGANISM="Togula jolla, Strain CCCM 725" /LENGTH=985 /DNA_ID=CAMNT_0010939617 /DNA_START=153 /DNA_END=3110 /DNA_ORIENTATION=-